MQRINNDPSGIQLKRRGLLSMAVVLSLGAFDPVQAIGASQQDSRLLQNSAAVLRPSLAQTILTNQDGTKEEKLAKGPSRGKAVVLSEPEEMADSLAQVVSNDNDGGNDGSVTVSQFAQQEGDTSVGGENQKARVTEMGTAAKWMQERPYLLIILAIASVVGCCFFSQILLRFSKQCNLSLNRYYIRKRFEKQKMMTNTIQQSRQIRSTQSRHKRQGEERGGESIQQEVNESRSDMEIAEEPHDQLELELDEEPNEQ